MKRRPDQPIVFGMNAPVLAGAAGFNLVEVSLAIMVVAVGMLGILSLFTTGLDQNVRAAGDSHAALFAEEIFSGLRAQAEANWANLGSNPVCGAAFSLWSDTIMNRVTDNCIETNIYQYAGIEDHVFRYRLQLTTNDNKTIKAATLSVWSGQFGTNLNNPIIFYSEYFKFR